MLKERSRQLFKTLGRTMLRFIRSKHLLAALILLALLGLFSIPGIFSDKVYSASDVLQQEPPLRFADTPADFIPDNRITGDAAVMFEPWRELLRRSITEQHELPLWNPHQGNGVPHMANAQSALFYPLTWLSTFGGPRWGILFANAIKLFAAGFGMYLFLRQLRVHFWVALLGGATWMFSSGLTVWLPWPITDGLALFPLLLYCIERAFIKKGSAAYVGLALLVALIIFSGHVQTAIHLFFVAASYGLFRLLVGRTGFVRRLRVAGMLVLSAALGFGLASVQLIPFIEYLQHSVVWAQRSAFTVNPYVQPLRLLGLLFMPDLVGNPAWSWAPDFVDNKLANFNDSTAGYVGLAPVIFAFAALPCAWRNKQLWFFVGLVGFVLAMVYRVPHVIFDTVTQLPGLSTVNHIRLLFLFGFAMVVIAALGVSAALTTGKVLARRYVGVLLGLAAVLIAVLIVVGSQIQLIAADTVALTTYLEYVRKIAPWYLAELVAAVALAIIVVRSKWSRVTSKGTGSMWVKALLLILAAPILLLPVFFRSMSYQPLVEPRYFEERSALIEFINSHSTPERTLSISRVAHVWPNLATRFGFYDPRNYDSVALKDSVDAQTANSQIVGTTQGVLSINPSYMSAVGTRYVVATDYAELQAQLGITNAEAVEFYPIVADFGSYKVFTNKRVWPRAFLVSDLDIFSKPQNVDLTTQVTIERYSNNEVSLLVTAPSDSYLVLSDSYFAGWNSYVDDMPQATLQADLNFRATALHQGAHRIVFTYQPASFTYGMAGSIIALVLLVTVPTVVTIWRKRL